MAWTWNQIKISLKFFEASAVPKRSASEQLSDAVMSQGVKHLADELVAIAKSGQMIDSDALSPEARKVLQAIAILEETKSLFLSKGNSTNSTVDQKVIENGSNSDSSISVTVKTKNLPSSKPPN